MKIIGNQLLKNTQCNSPVFEEQSLSFLIQYSDIFSSITMDSFYVLDILKQQFYYIKPDDLFLCGFSVEEAQRSGVYFFQKIIHPEDLLLCIDMHKAVLRYLKDFEGRQDEIDYISCTFRLQRNCNFPLPRPLPQMIYHLTKYIWENDELRYLICSMRSSTDKEVGNLCVYNKDGLTYKEYNFTTKRWKQETKITLTERERAILILAGQGKNTKEIANHLCKGLYTIRNQIKSLFSKLSVNSMQEALEYVRYHRIIHPKLK